MNHMKDIINLNDNYYIKVVNKTNEIPYKAISIENLKLIKVLKENYTCDAKCLSC